MQQQSESDTHTRGTYAGHDTAGSCDKCRQALGRGESAIFYRFIKTADQCSPRSASTASVCSVLQWRGQVEFVGHAMYDERDGKDEDATQDATGRRWQSAEAIALSGGPDFTVCALYVAYSLSLRNLERMMGERGIEVDHSSVHHQVIKLVPLFEKALRKLKFPVGQSWRVDEAYIRVKGQWKYLYRGVDRQGNAVDGPVINFVCKADQNLPYGRPSIAFYK